MPVKIKEAENETFWLSKYGLYAHISVWIKQLWIYVHEMW